MSPLERLMIEIGGQHFQTEYNVLTDEDIEKLHPDTQRFMEDIKQATFNKSLYNQIQASPSIPQNQKSFVSEIYQYLISKGYLLA